MPYELNRYNREYLTRVQDGNTESSSSSLTFVGKNFAGYGAIQNENFLYLLENFANSSPPSNPIRGQLWYDTGARKLRFYDISYNGGATEPTTYAKWRPAGAEIGSVQPTGMTVGDFWFDTATSQLKVYTGGTIPFVVIGPQAVANSGQTNLESVSIKNNFGTAKPVVKAVVNNETVFIISNEPFTVSTDESVYAKFPAIKQGITLSDTSTDGSAIGNYRVWGTASDADRLGNFPASSYVKQQSATFTNLATFANAGLTVNGYIKLSYDNQAIVENTKSSTLSFKVTDQSSNTRNPLILSGNNVIPGAQEGNPLAPVYNLGTVQDRWNNVYAKSMYTDSLTVSSITVTGNIAATSPRADALFYSGSNSYVIASSGNDNNTIVARDSSGNFAANVITATVTQARYADLAERYAADAEYEPGTVVVFGGDQEITVTDITCDFRVAGIISTNPAYLMNEAAGDNITHPPVALKGKVPVKVIGTVKKGDCLVTSNIKGYAQAIDSTEVYTQRSYYGQSLGVFAKSLENKTTDDAGIIMAVVI